MQKIQFDPRLPQFRLNPYPFYDMLRQAAPIFWWEEWDVWFLTRYDDCNTLLRDNRFGHGDFGELPEEREPLWRMQSNWMLFKNPPDHTRLRTLVHKAFTPRMVKQLEGTIQAITDRLLDQVQEAGEMDLMADLAFPLPVIVIAEMLGVPSDDHEQFRLWSNDLGRTLDLTKEVEVYERGSEAAEVSMKYFRELAAQRRANPQDDLLSALVMVEEEGDKLNEDELFGTITLLLFAGHETTINLIGNGMLALLRHPEQLELLKNNPRLIKTAVEELLRYDSAVQMTSRTALQNIEWKGHTFERGQQVNFMLGAANRDPDMFEHPNQLDITRQRNRHLAFGSGIHYCIGAPLARLEGEIAINSLLRRMPNLTLAINTPEYRDNYLLRGLTSLPVTW